MPLWLIAAGLVGGMWWFSGQQYSPVSKRTLKRLKAEAKRKNPKMKIPGSGPVKIQMKGDFSAKCMPIRGGWDRSWVTVRKAPTKKEAKEEIKEIKDQPRWKREGCIKLRAV